ncbi:hypothetical protein M413DRAFT_446806 [Hebeloma cylindrosporum]|uniref:F-box domain-containing protein n=1 Tax=Hebeloma cylindrosporum TaxID=76867 RepID=A0A0C3BT78_HEBCY|nr:hypothetical protein M413DRAFT_446806 [Hebeloma cylindrosporum h7]
MHWVNNVSLPPMPPLLLSSEETWQWLRRSGPPAEDELPRIADALQFHEAHLHHLKAEIDARLDPAPGIADVGKCCGLSLPRWLVKRRKRTDPALITLDDLRKTQKNALAEIKSLRSLLAPIRRLPPELLTEIFMHCLPRQRFIRPAPDQAPLLLAQICAAWRLASISIPSLWTSLELHGFETDTMEDDPPPEEDTQRINNLMHTWFSRTEDCPLSLSVLDDSLLLPSVSKKLDDFAGRWQHLSLLVSEHTHRCLDPSYEYSSLESFKLHTVEGLDEVLVHDLSGTMFNAPKLTRFIWENVVPQFTPLEMIWENLTYLTLSTPMTIQQCLEILPSCSVSLPELKSLVLCSSEDIYPVLNALTLPNLREFVLNIWSWPHTSILDMFHRSRCPLESLNLYHPPLSEVQLLECLERVHTTLIELTLQSSADDGLPITDAVLERLTNTGVGEVLCPKLQVIAMYQCIRCTEGRFADMVRSRLLPSLPRASPIAEDAPRPSVDTLKVVEMYEEEVMALGLLPLRNLGLVFKMYSLEDGSSIELNQEDVERLRELKEHGLVLKVYSPVTGHYGEEDYY